MKSALLRRSVDREGSREHFSSISVSFRCGGEGRECCGKMRLGSVWYSSGSEWGESVGTEWGRLATHFNGEKCQGGEREETSVRMAENWVGE